MSKQHYMTYSERIRLEEKLRYKVPIAQIARELGFSRQTIYNEIRRGTYLHNVDYAYEPRYSADKGQQIHEKQMLNKGRGLKIGHDIAYADFLEHKVLHDKYSPAAALAEAREEGFTTSICVGTFYNYIDQGVFYQLTNNDLWEKPKRKKKAERPESRVAHPELPSIEIRPAYINDRSEYGHWEMDLVVGPQKGSPYVLLVLTERQTKQVLIFRLPNKKAATVRRVFDHLERTMSNFYEVFKSITTDNGSEFLEYELLKKSVLGGDRFEVYYCHSYAAWEKGGVENQNRMIRRFFPKGTDFGKVPKRKVADLEAWMNGYPRKSLNWQKPGNLAV